MPTPPKALENMSKNLTEEERQLREQAEEGERFILYSDAITIYTAQFLDSDWDCGLDQEGLKARFHTSQDNWDTSQ